MHYLLLSDHAYGHEPVYLPESQPASWPCVQIEVECRYHQLDITVPKIPPESGELKTELLRLKVRKHESQISQNRILNSVNNILYLKYKYFLIY